MDWLSIVYSDKNGELSFVVVEKLVNEKNMSNEGDTTFGRDTTLGLQGYK